MPHFTNSNNALHALPGFQYSIEGNSLVKLGKALKEDDLVLLHRDPSGVPSVKQFTWKATAAQLVYEKVAVHGMASPRWRCFFTCSRPLFRASASLPTLIYVYFQVKEFIYSKGLTKKDLVLGNNYALYVTHLRKLMPFTLVSLNIKTGHYIFSPVSGFGPDIIGNDAHFPEVYTAGTKKHTAEQGMVLESVLRNDYGKYATQKFDFQAVEKKPFNLDIKFTHVVEAIGKPHGSPVHFSTTTYEPYGVACLSGLKVSMLMHSFGTPRWHVGIVDDIRSHSDQNTRVIGDFTKTVNSKKIVEYMYDLIANDKNWKLHFEKVMANDFDAVVKKHCASVYKKLKGYVEPFSQSVFHVLLSEHCGSV